MAERLPTTLGQAHVEFRWSANAAPNLRQAIVEDVTNDSEEATGKQCTGGVSVADHDTPKRKRYATEDWHDRPNKRARPQENDIVAAPIGSAVGSSRGHSYQNVLATDNAYVLMGDQHIVNNNYSDPFEGINILLQRFWDADPDERDEIVYLAASVIAVAALHAMVQRLFCLIGRIHPAGPGAIQQRIPSLLSRVGYRFAIFEDAFGRIKSIDIDILTDWTAFHEELTKDFKDKPGHRRVALARYRLFDQVHSDYVIHPRDPPPFASLFRPKAHVLMSVHFESDEIPNPGRCPKCRTWERYKHGETACKCGLRYRAEKGKPIDYYWNKRDGFLNRSDSHVASHGDGSNIGVGGKARTSASKGDEDDPAPFNRIIVSYRPHYSEVTIGVSARHRYGKVYNSTLTEGRSVYSYR